ncbi:S8 family serine peptidase [Streptomyces sp. NPDC088729]|uniref:S8 family serine peptidase n=1 Tax=Streptomyces sp. NPDC088729 TaxID=3365876 RepID=UPI0037F43428
MTCTQAAENGVLPALDTLVDLAPLGTNDGGPRPRMAATITAAPAMSRAERQSLLREALVHMAREFGYVDAELDALQAPIGGAVGHPEQLVRPRSRTRFPRPAPNRTTAHKRSASRVMRWVRARLQRMGHGGAKMQDTVRRHGSWRRAAGVTIAALAVSAGTVIPAAADTDPPDYLKIMKAREIWKVADGTGITVAVIDSGVKEVAGLRSESVLPGVSFMEPPFERPDQQYPPHDDFVGHGTTMTAAIVGDGSAGGPKGLAPGAKVLPIRTSVGTPMAFAVGAEAAKGLRYAADNGAKVINLSIGVTPDWSMDKIRPAVQYAQSKGALIFAAMGNEGAGNNFNNTIAMLPGVIGVGAVDEKADPLAFSSHGPDTDLSAFGGKAPIRCNENKVWCVADGGTSYATSLAAASAALAWSAHPDWTANQVARVLIQTAGAPRDGAKRNDWIGYGNIRPRMPLLERAGDPGAPDVDPLAAPAPAKTPAPSTDQTAAVGTTSADAASGLPWQWPALGTVFAASLGLGITVIVKRRR